MRVGTGALNVRGGDAEMPHVLRIVRLDFVLVKDKLAFQCAVALGGRQPLVAVGDIGFTQGRTLDTNAIQVPVGAHAAVIVANCHAGKGAQFSCLEGEYVGASTLKIILLVGQPHATAGPLLTVYLGKYMRIRARPANVRCSYVYAIGHGCPTTLRCPLTFRGPIVVLF